MLQFRYSELEHHNVDKCLTPDRVKVEDLHNSILTSGKVDPRIWQTVGTKSAKKPGLALSFSVA